MQESQQETEVSKYIFNIKSTDFAIKQLESLLPWEQEDLPLWRAGKESVEQYQPLDEARIRFIDIKSHVSRFPRIEQTVLENLEKLRQEVADLRRQVVDLTEFIEKTTKIYNAFIYELGDEQYQLTMPLQIVLEEDEEETVARIPELNLYASEDTGSEAINELKHEVIRLFEELNSSKTKLGPLPASWFITLRKLIVKK
jgi:hypothetical protein